MSPPLKNVNNVVDVDVVVVVEIGEHVD